MEADFLLPHVAIQLLACLYLLAQAVTTLLIYGTHLWTIVYAASWLAYVMLHFYFTYVVILCYRYIRFKASRTGKREWSFRGIFYVKSIFNK